MNFALKVPAELFSDPFPSTDQPHKSQHYHYKIWHFTKRICPVLLNGTEVAHMGSDFRLFNSWHWRA